jgi:pimeloyl-ACP methyl ester carboxylesterase
MGFRRIRVKHAEVDISAIDFGGEAPPLLMLHGLCGAAQEWAETAQCLQESHRVIAMDQRGHGQSSKDHSDVSLETLACDAAMVIEELREGPAVVLGQSMGGVIGMLLAERWPHLMRALIVVEATAQSTMPGSAQRWISLWPTSFRNEDEARSFFASQGMKADVWVATLERRGEALFPAFRVADMLAIAKHLDSYDCRESCRRIAAPALVIAGSKSWLPRAEVQTVADLIPKSQFVVIDGAGHDVHLDAPGQFHEAVSAFVK